MAHRIAVNGFGRIGRLVFRFLEQMENMEVVALNDIAPIENLAYLLRYDSVQQPPDTEVFAEGGNLCWGARKIQFLSERNPAQLPWKELKVEIVIEASGHFTKKDDAELHRKAGAERVLITAPAKGGVPTFCMGVNADKYDPSQHFVVSNASCTTNCLTPVAKALNDAFGIRTGFLTTIHAITSSQSIVDAPHKKMRRGRCAFLNIVPTTTGAAIAATEVLPELKGKLDGLAMRVPVGSGSIIDFVVHTEKPVTVDAVNKCLKSASKSDAMRGILGYTEEELVSSDIIGCEYSALVDGQSTMVLGDHTAKVLAWYDNEWGYSKRCADLAGHMCGVKKRIA